MASRQLSAKKPKDLGHTLRTLLSYLGRHKLLFLAVAVLVALSALANLLGTYMIRPVVNSLAAGSLNTLVLGVAVTAAIYGAGVLSALGYTQIMVKAAQKVPQMRFVAWDVAITEKGPVFIEGNSFPSHAIPQFAAHFPDGIGILPRFEAFIDL